MATWRARSRWHRCAASGCSLAGPSSSGAAPRLRWRWTAPPCARACGGRWQTRSEAAPLASPRPVAPPACCVAPQAREAPARSTARCQVGARLGAQLARTAACGARWLHGVHTAGRGGRRAAFVWYPGAVPDARLAVRLERLAATVLRRGTFRASCAAAPHRPLARDKPVLPVTRAHAGRARTSAWLNHRLDRVRDVRRVRLDSRAGFFLSSTPHTLSAISGPACDVAMSRAILLQIDQNVRGATVLSLCTPDLSSKPSSSCPVRIVVIRQKLSPRKINSFSEKI